jgi:hypothetical protein
MEEKERSPQEIKITADSTQDQAQIQRGLRTLIELAISIGRREGLIGKGLPQPFADKHDASDVHRQG